MKTKIVLVSKKAIRILVTREKFRQQKCLTAFMREKHLIAKNESGNNNVYVMARKAAKLLGSCARGAAMAESTDTLTAAPGLSWLCAGETGYTTLVCVCDTSLAVRS